MAAKESPVGYSIPAMLEKLQKRYNEVSLTFVRVAHTGDCWWGIKCTAPANKTSTLISMGGFTTPGAALKKAIETAGALK